MSGDGFMRSNFLTPRPFVMLKAHRMPRGRQSLHSHFHWLGDLILEALYQHWDNAGREGLSLLPFIIHTLDKSKTRWLIPRFELILTRMWFFVRELPSYVPLRQCRAMGLHCLSSNSATIPLEGGFFTLDEKQASHLTTRATINLELFLFLEPTGSASLMRWLSYLDFRGNRVL